MSELPRIEPPDMHYLSAAVGWLELGNVVEATAELEQICPANQSHPDVLEVRWALCAKQEDWRGALSAARAIVESAPERASGWLHRAYAVRRVPGGGLQQAWDALLPAFKMFPGETIIPFNLACYACQMSRLDEAREWFQRALAVGNREKLKQMALADADLEPLWNEIREL